MKTLFRYTSQPEPDYNVHYVKQIGRRSGMPVGHYHNSFEISCVFSGDRYYLLESGMYHVTAGGLVLIKPYSPHSTVSALTDDYERGLVSFNEESLNFLSDSARQRLLSVMTEKAVVLRLSCDQLAEMRVLFDRLLCEFNTPRKDSDIGNQLLLGELLVFIGRAAAAAKRQSVSAQTPGDGMGLISGAARYIGRRFRDDLTLKEVAAELFVSPAHLSRIFVKNTGMGFVEYRNNLRIIEAQCRLRGSCDSISDIACGVGFSSHGDFSRVFKQYVGLSPREYRRAYRGKN